MIEAVFSTANQPMIDKFLRQSIEVWTPNYPRNVARPEGSEWGQHTVQGPEEVLAKIKAGWGDIPGYVSVNSFPNEHTSDGGVPKLDTFYLDFDLDDSGKTELEWKYHLQALLEDISTVAEALVEAGQAKYWRASLSGHKGVHMYLDFESGVEGVADGSLNKAKNGLKSFEEDLMDGLIEMSGIDDLWEILDVSSADPARLTRLPNTIHGKATERFGETRFCVPVSIEELADVTTAEDYKRLTRRPRTLPDSTIRVESRDARKILTENMALAKGGGRSGGPTDYDYSRVRKYDEEVANQDLTLDHLMKISLSTMPCIAAWRENPEEMFAHGHASRQFELHVLSALKNARAPKSVMHEFMSVSPDYSEEKTDEAIAAVIAGGFAERDPDSLEGGEEYAGTADNGERGFNCETIHRDAPEFCLGPDCSKYQRIFADDPDVQITN